MSKQKNVKNLIMNVLPDNRPITSLQIVEDHDKYVQLKCPPTHAFLCWEKNHVKLIKSIIQISDAQRISCQFIERMIKILMRIYGEKRTFLDDAPHVICVYQKVKAFRNIL